MIVQQCPKCGRFMEIMSQTASGGTDYERIVRLKCKGSFCSGQRRAKLRNSEKIFSGKEKTKY